MERGSLVFEGDDQDSLRRNEARYRSMVSALTDYVWVCGTDGRLRTDMPTWRAITGQSVEELLGLGWLEGVHPEDRAHTAQVWEAAVRTEGPYVVEYRITGPGGTAHLDVRGAPVRGEDGAVTEWIGSCTDVTEQRRLAADIADERETLRHVVEQSRTAVVLLRGPDLVFHHFNAAYERMIPANRARIGMPLAEALPETAHLIPSFQRVMADGRQLDWPELAIPFDGPGSFNGFRYYHVSYSRVTYAEGERGILGIGVETTDEVRRRSDLEERLTAERRLGAELQRALLPESVPSVPDLDLAVRYRPATAAGGVGGDWYDVVAVRPDRVVLAIGDVCGTGLPAATGMAQLRAATHTHALEGLEPGAILDRVGRYCTRLEIADMATLVVVALDPVTGTLTWASAGHPPPLLVGAGQRAEALWAVPQPALGTGAAGYRDHVTTLPAGAALVLYTDGLVERRGVALDTAVEELRLLAAGDWETAGALRDAVVRGLPHSGEDDLALLVCRRPSGHWLHRRFDAEPRLVADMRDTAVEAARAVGCPPELLDRVRLATSEAATNAVVHARRHEPEPGPVELTVAVRDAELVVAVVDHGAGVTPRSDSPGAGVGLQIIRHLCDRVEWSRPETGGTRVTLAFALPA